jgi:hypothetical protein
VGASATIAHATSSRMRLRVEGRPREVAGVLESIAGHAGDHPAIGSVRTDPRTGSALLTWDPDELDLDAAVELVRTAHEALREVVPPRMAAAVERPLSLASSRLLSRLSLANRRVHEATAGKVDLRFLVPVGFAALSIRQVLRTGPQLASMPWYGLAYYAFDSFVKLHGTDHRAGPEVTA